MEKKKPFKVIIAGGSIGGLALANMLQKHGIDYVVLEAYPEIAPHVGASIGLFPNGLRILDQLGIYQDIVKFVKPVDRFCFWDDKGQFLADYSGIDHAVIERHGYPVAFLHRQLALRVMYDHVEDKSKILTRKAIRKVDLLQGQGVKITTKDGDTFTGDILVGSDGVHSRTRQEMVRLAQEMSPGYFPVSEATAVPCDYACIFGISNPCPGVKAGSFMPVYGNNYSYLLVGELNDRVFWLHFFALEKRAHSPNIPRYTKKDEARQIKAHENDILMPGLTFGDVVKRRVSSNMTALSEYTYKQWHFNRITTIGDAVHTFHIIGGQGGNAAIETAATLANGLIKALNDSPSGTLTESQISFIFQEAQDIRRDRVAELITRSHKLQRVYAMRNPLLKFFALQLLPRLSLDGILSNLSQSFPDAQKLDGIELKPRALLVPYHDSLLRLPRDRGWCGKLIAAGFILMALFGVWVMHIQVRRPSGMLEYRGSAVANGTTYTGTHFVGRWMTLDVARFTPDITEVDPTQSTLQRYFYISLFSVLSVWSVEACRKRNFLALISFTTIWAVCYQSIGIGIFGPLYYAAYLRASSHHNYWWPLSRQVPTAYAKSILPALILGYLLPTIAMYIPYSSPTVTNAVIVFWRPSPIYVNILLFTFSRVYGKIYPADLNPSANKPMPDLRTLETIYIFCLVTSTIAHASMILTALQSQLSFTSIFIPTGSVVSTTYLESIRNVWLFDFWIFFLATLVWCWVAVWDLNRVGRASINLGKAAVVLGLAAVTFGPGAMLAGCWYWREGKMARTFK